MKYIVFEVSHTQAGPGRRIPVIFPEEFTHRDVARSMMPLIRNFYPRFKVASAGTFDTTDGEAKGNSESLGVAADPSDGELILNFDTTKGF